MRTCIFITNKKVTGENDNNESFTEKLFRFVKSKQSEGVIYEKLIFDTSVIDFNSTSEISLKNIARKLYDMSSYLIQSFKYVNSNNRVHYMLTPFLHKNTKPTNFDDREKYIDQVEEETYWLTKRF